MSIYEAGLLIAAAFVWGMVVGYIGALWLIDRRNKRQQ